MAIAERTDDVRLGANITIDAEIQGVHGTVPPLEEIVDTLVSWLQRIYEGVAENLNFKVQVECRRIPVARSFYGVHIVGPATFSDSVLDIRVRPRGSTHQWRCFLATNGFEMASYIMHASRPETVRFVESLWQSDMDMLGSMAKLPTNLGERRSIKKAAEMRQLNSLAKSLHKRQNRQWLCYLISQNLTEDEMVPSDVFRDALVRVVGAKSLSAAEFDHLMMMVCAFGIAEPVDATDRSFFLLTLHFDELCDTYRLDKAKNDLLHVNSSFAALDKKEDSLKRESDRISKRLAEIAKELDQVEVDRNGLYSERERLEAVIEVGE